jgi:hypothetical protein
MGRLIPFLLFPLHLFAIVNISVIDVNEKEGNETKRGFYGEVEFAFNSSFGNSQTRDYEFHGSIIHFGEDNFWLLKGSFVYESDYIVQSDEYQEVENKSFWHLRNVRGWTEKTAIEIFAQTQHDQFQSMKLRALGGIGLRFRPFLNGFYIGFSPIYVHEEYTRTYLNSFDTYRFNSYIAYKTAVGEKGRLYFQSYYQPRFEDIEDYSVYTAFQYRHKITDKLSLSLKILYEFDSTPVDNIETYDTEQKLSLIYEF